MAKKHHPARQDRGVVRNEFSSAMFSGPLPPPSVLTKYNEAVPNAAERILVMAEKQAVHRQSLEERVVNANIRNQYLGSVFGFILGAFAIGGGIYLIAHGMSATGLTSVIGALVALVAVFVTGRRGQEKERQANQP
jgi:uncharacterized membrane protein